MNKYLLILKNQMSSVYLKQVHSTSLPEDISLSFTKYPGQALKLPDEEYADSFCNVVNKSQPLEFTVIHISFVNSEKDEGAGFQKESETNVPCEGCELGLKERTVDGCAGCTNEVPVSAKLEPMYETYKIPKQDVIDAHKRGVRARGVNSDNFMEHQYGIALNLVAQQHDLEYDMWEVSITPDYKFYLIKYKDDNTSKALSEDDMEQKAEFIETQISEPHDIMICRNCGHFSNPDKCPQNDLDHVSCPSAISIEKECGNCKFRALHYNKGPCKICTEDYLPVSQWEPILIKKIKNDGVVDTDAAHRQVD